MPGARIVGAIAALVLVGITALIGYSIWFCAGALKGDLAGCAVSAGLATLLSPPVSMALTAAAIGLFYATMRRK